MKYEEAPIISVVIACYNQGIYLSDALNSLEKQTFQNWEGIIVNDGSTDNTLNILKVLLNVEKSTQLLVLGKSVYLYLILEDNMSKTSIL